MAHDLYRPLPRPAPGDAAITRRALLGLGRRDPGRHEPDHAGATARVRAAWNAGGHEPLLRALAPVGAVVADLAAADAGDRVLDVGAGDGNVALACVARGATVDACDLAPAMVERGRERCGADVRWTVADAARLPYADATFDVVLSAFGAALATAPARTAGELARVARPGARIVLAAWSPRGLPGGLEELADRIAPRPAGIPAAADWGQRATAHSRLSPWVERTEFRTRTVRLRFADADVAFSALAAGTGLEGRALAALRPGFDRLLASCNDAVAGVEIAARYLVVSGTRS